MAVQFPSGVDPCHASIAPRDNLALQISLPMCRKCDCWSSRFGAIADRTEPMASLQSLGITGIVRKLHNRVIWIHVATFYLDMSLKA